MRLITYASSKRLKDASVDYVKLSAATDLPGELVECWLEIIFSEEDTRQLQPIELLAERLRIDEWCSEDFERPRSATAFGNVGCLQQAHPRVNCSSSERWHVRRGHYPGQASVVKPHLAVPSFHRQNRQLTISKLLLLKLLSQLA